jgi:hypothetical protein
MKLCSVELLKLKRDPLKNPPWKYSWASAPITREEIATVLQNSDFGLGQKSRNEFWTPEEHANRGNHVRRIAYLVEHRSEHPIKLTDGGHVDDGWHRVAAAIYRGDETITSE